MLGILDLCSVCLAKLLTKLYSAGRTEFHASSAGHTLLLVHVSHIGGPGHVGRVEQLRSSQSVADVHVTVTNGEDLFLTVDIGYLMNEAVVLGFLQEFHDLFSCDVSSVLVGLHHVIRHVANSDTPVELVVAAVHIIGLSCAAAGAGGCGILAIILVQPVRDVLHAYRLVFHLNGLLHRNDVHTDAGTSGRNHLGDLLQRKSGHEIEEISKLGMLPK